MFIASLYDGGASSVVVMVFLAMGLVAMVAVYEGADGAVVP